MEEDGSLWEVDHDLARDRVAARRRRIARRLDMSDKLSAGMRQLLQVDQHSAEGEGALLQEELAGQEKQDYVKVLF